LEKVNDSDLWRKSTVLWLAAMNGGGESVELISAGDASLRSMVGGEKCCDAERLVLGALFILWGGARQRIVSGRQRRTSLRRQVFNCRLRCR
jgi:hypothetical protein